MLTFDASTREKCTVRRPRTNTPLQALVLMNDQQYVEASRRLAARMLTEGGPELSGQLALGFRLCTARQPDAGELQVLARIYAGHLAHYQQQPEAAAKLLAIGASPAVAGPDPIPHAAMTMTANLLLNLDETITKE